MKRYTCKCGRFIAYKHVPRWQCQKCNGSWRDIETGQHLVVNVPWPFRVEIPKFREIQDGEPIELQKVHMDFAESPQRVCESEVDVLRSRLRRYEEDRKNSVRKIRYLTDKCVDLETKSRDLARRCRESEAKTKDLCKRAQAYRKLLVRHVGELADKGKSLLGEVLEVP